jgi:hypothetical protein
MREFHSQYLARLAAVVGMLLAALVLVGCARTSGEQGATFSDPEEALLTALGPGGWLGPIEQVRIHTLEDAPESRVALYSARRADGNGWFVGVADAKRAWGGWQAHGRIGVISPPPLEGEVSCAQFTAPAGGAEWQVIVGAFDPARVATVEVVTEAGVPAPAALRDGIVTAMDRAPSELRALRALDAAGTLVTELPLTDCVAP